MFLSCKCGIKILHSINTIMWTEYNEIMFYYIFSFHSPLQNENIILVCIFSMKSDLMGRIFLGKTKFKAHVMV